jgi:hypothetical protein
LAWEPWSDNNTMKCDKFLLSASEESMEQHYVSISRSPSGML